MSQARASTGGWIGWIDRLVPGGKAPIGLKAQFKRNIVLYAIGTAMLAIQQFLLGWRDFLVKDAVDAIAANQAKVATCLLYTSPSPRDQRGSRMPSSA